MIKNKKKYNFMREKIAFSLILAFLFSISLIKAAEYNTYLYTDFSITKGPYIMKLLNGDFLILADKYIICKDILNNATCFNIANDPNFFSYLVGVIDETLTNGRIRLVYLYSGYVYQYYNTAQNYTNFQLTYINLGTSTTFTPSFSPQKFVITANVSCQPNGVYTVRATGSDTSKAWIVLLNCSDTNIAYLYQGSSGYTGALGNSVFLGNASIQIKPDYYDTSNALTRPSLYYCYGSTCYYIISISPIIKWGCQPLLDAFFDSSGNIKTLVAYVLGYPNGATFPAHFYAVVWKDGWGPINIASSYVSIIVSNVSSSYNINLPFWLDENTFIIAYDNANSRLLACKILSQQKQVNCNWYITPNYANQFTSFLNQTLFFQDGKMHLITVRQTSSNSILINYKIYDVLIDAVDEITLMPKVSDILIFRNDGVSYEYSYNTSAYLFYNINSGNYLLRVGTATIPYRFYSDLYKNSHLRQTTYLLDANYGLYYTFYVTDYNNMPIQNATITVYLYDRGLGAWVVATRNKVNPDGSFSAFLRYGQLYKVMITADGYNTLYFDFVTDPNVRTVFIKLSKTGTQTGGEVKITFNTLFDNIVYSFQPSNYYNSGNVTIKYIINDKAGSLEYFKMQIYKVNLTGEQLIYDNTIYTSPQGGELSYMATENGKYKVIACFKKQNTTEYCHMPQYYFIYTPQAYETELPNLLSGGAYLMIALIITALVSGFFAVWFGNYTLAFLIGAGVFGVFVALNPSAMVGGVELYKIYIITIFVAGAFIFIKSYI